MPDSEVIIQSLGVLEKGLWAEESGWKVGDMVASGLELDHFTSVVQCFPTEDAFCHNIQTTSDATKLHRFCQWLESTINKVRIIRSAGHGAASVHIGNESTLSMLRGFSIEASSIDAKGSL